MTPLQLATLIGNALTQVDAKLADPAFPMSDPNWQTLYALRSISTIYSVRWFRPPSLRMIHHILSLQSKSRVRIPIYKP
jgi:hypothetical protein